MTSNVPKVSIITCFLNVEAFIDEAIKSVLLQDYTNWELILFDDGSNDGSTDIAKKYTSAYPDKIFYKEHQSHVNKGLSASRNAAISEATGEFITFLDADDVWLPGYLSHQVNLINSLPV